MRLEIEIQLDVHMHPPLFVWQYKTSSIFIVNSELPNIDLASMLLR